MKKILFTLICASFIFAGSVYAEEETMPLPSPETVDTSLKTDNVDTEVLTETEEIVAEDIYENKIVLNIKIGEVYNLLPKNMVFGLYDSDKNFCGAQRIWVTDTLKEEKLIFDIPGIYHSNTLYFKVFSGAERISFLGQDYKTEELIPLALSPAKKNEFTIDAIPLSAEAVKCYANGWELYFKNPAKLINGVCMIPVEEYTEALWMKHCFYFDEANNRIEVSANGHEVVFYLDGHDMYKDGEIFYTDSTPIKINQTIYVPFRFLVESLGGEVFAKYEDGLLNAESKLVYEGLTKSERFVNDNSIKSKTDYLIWVSKKDYKVTVFVDRHGTWKEIRSFDCSIGAPDTPTITGEFDYFSKEPRWSYPTYYVEPIMRFYSGYALHSTLIRYNGATADGRLRKQISHGCVRLAPPSINWLADTIPLYTKVYITD